ncbi:MAG: polyribonucleotide nucleotidyltransferase [Candidatus Saccharimonadales bacterium]
MSNIIHPFNGKQIKVETEFCGKKLSIETGQMAFLADGAALVRYGDTVVLGTAVVGNTPRDGIDFFPLLIDYEERMYATGKISGSRYMKREGRPSETATLTARLIDRPIRPLFPKGFRNDTQVVTTVLSADMEHSIDVIAMIAASAALMLSGAPFAGPISGIKVGLIDDKLVPYPSNKDLDKSKLDLTVAGTKDAIMMVEAGANEVDEDTMAKALELAHESLQPVIELQNELVKKMGIETMEYEAHEDDEGLENEMREFLRDKLGPAVRHESHYERHRAISNLQEEVIEHFSNNHADKFEKAHILESFDSAIKAEVRRAIIEEGQRPDNRKADEVRPLSSAVGVLPKTHGSALFTRGSTQVLNITTLASSSFALSIDSMEEDSEKHFMHHYNFPGYSVGEVKPMRTPGRREIGHGALAERAVAPMIPSQEDFPYVIRSVSEVTTSNGSTSMASVCGTTLSMMDAGVPLIRPVSGIAMGLMMGDAGKYEILSDIAGAEDFAGDMDFKVAGTEQGITALQMDIKVGGITPKIMAEALAQAKAGRAHILKAMLETIAEPREELNHNAPRILKIKINPEKIGEVIGRGGETINGIIDETGAQIDIKDDGLVLIAAEGGNNAGAEKAVEIIKGLTEDPEIGNIYEGEVVKITDFGAFVNVLPGKDGLLHISEIADKHIDKVEDELKEGDVIKVKLIGIDDMGRLKLSKKSLKE